MLKLSDDPEVLEVHVVPSEEVRIVPLSPTTTNNPLEMLVVVLLSSLLFLAQEMTEKLKQEIRKMNKTFFIFSSIPKVKYQVRRTQYIPELGGIYKNVGSLRKYSLVILDVSETLF